MTENCNYLCVIPGPGLCPMMLNRSFQVPKSRFSCHPAHCLQGLSEHRLFSREEICHCSILSSIFTYTNITGASVDRYVNLVVHSCIKVHDFRSVLVQEHTWLQAFNSETLVCVLACVISREGLSLLIHLPFLDDFKPDLILKQSMCTETQLQGCTDFKTSIRDLLFSRISSCLSSKSVTIPNLSSLERLLVG